MASFRTQVQAGARRFRARALSRAGDEIVPRAIPLLKHKKVDRRAWAVKLLSTVGSASALSAFESRLDEEPDDEVRDSMLLALDAAQAASGKEVTRAEIADRVSRAAKKLQAPVAAWLDESRLPALRYTDGTAGTRYNAVPALPPVEGQGDAARRRSPPALRPD